MTATTVVSRSAFATNACSASSCTLLRRVVGALPTAGDMPLLSAGGHKGNSVACRLDLVVVAESNMPFDRRLSDVLKSVRPRVGVDGVATPRHQATAREGIGGCHRRSPESAG